MNRQKNFKTSLITLFTFLLSFGHGAMAATLVMNNSQVSHHEVISITKDDTPNIRALNSVLSLLLQTVGVVPVIATSKPQYSLNENINVMLGGLSGDQDWVGIYRKDDSNDWGNVISWEWAADGTLTLDGLPGVGEYEVRLFFHNSFEIEATFAFNVNDNDNVVIETYADKDYVVYRPKDHLDNAPILLAVSYSTVLGDPNNPAFSQRLEGLMKYIASQGVYVIGHTANTGGDAPSAGLIPLFETALTESLVKYPRLNKAKFGVIGQSRGGGHVFKIMQYFKSQQYGSDTNFVVPLDGSFAHEMSTADLNNLHTDSLFIQFGGAIGNITDPRRTLSINKLLPGDTYKGFITIDTNLGHDWDDHLYAYGNLETFLTKKELAKSINAIVDYELFDIQNAKNGVFDPDSTAATIQDIKNNLKADPHDYDYACDGQGTAEQNTEYIFLEDVDYCTAYLP